MRSARPAAPPPALAAAALALAASAGCATAPTMAVDTLAARAEGRFQDASDGAPAAPARLPAPESTHQAQTYLSGALAALRANQPQHAALFLDAILGSDHLSDRGRANIYWLAADAHHLAEHDGEYIDALGGFLVAADLLPIDEDLRVRQVEARATLLARKVKRDPLLGKSPRAAIRVEDPRDAAGVAVVLGCVEQAVSTHGIRGEEQSEERRLEERRLLCEGDRESVVLWFDVTRAPR